MRLIKSANIIWEDPLRHFWRFWILSKTIPSPCGIYDPHDALQAAQTVIRMTELIQGLDLSDPASHHALARYTATKEDHGKKAKDDLLIIWTDYFKPEHLEKYPDLHTLVWDACKLGSAAKQNVDMDAAVAFKAAIQKVGDIFWETKA